MNRLNTFTFTNGGFLAEAIDVSRGLAPQHNAHAYEFRRMLRDANQAWCIARVKASLKARRAAEEAQWAQERAR